MIITSVDVMLLDQDPLSRPGWQPIGCRVHTDKGIFGDGEAALAFGVGARGAFGAIQDFARLVIGMDPLANEAVWEKLYKQTFWGQNGGPMTFAAISAIDVALWDIKGKHFGAPAWQLLGGKMRDSLRSYASQLQFGWGDTRTPALSLSDYAENARAAVAEGFDAVKFDFLTFDEDGRPFTREDTTRLLPPRIVNLVRNRVEAVRDAVGPDVDIIMENHAVYDAQGAVQVGEAVKPYGIYYYEEPCTPNPKMTKFVCDKLNIPISLGERVYSRWQYAPYFEDGSVQLIQPDLGSCGGITEAKKICDMAHVYDVGVQAHVCSSPLLVAASLQLEAVIPNFTIHEHHTCYRLESNKRLCVHDYQPHDGRFSIPDEPGIGNEFSPYFIDHSTHVVVE